MAAIIRRVNNLTVEYNIVQNVSSRWHRRLIIRPAAPSAVTSGSKIADNLVRNFKDYGVVLAYNAYGDGPGNTIVGARQCGAPIWMYDFTQRPTASAKTVNVTGNT